MWHPRARREEHTNSGTPRGVPPTFTRKPEPTPERPRTEAAASCRLSPVFRSVPVPAEQERGPPQARCTRSSTRTTRRCPASTGIYHWRLHARIRKVNHNHLAGRNRHIHIGAHIVPRILRQDHVPAGRKIVKLKRLILRDALPRSDHSREHHSVGPIGGRRRMLLARQRFHERGGGKQPPPSGRIYRDSGARTRLDIPGDCPNLDRPRQRTAWCAARDRCTRRAEPQRGEDGEQQQRGKTSAPQPAMARLTPQHLIKHRQPFPGAFSQRAHLPMPPLDA